MFFYNTVEQKYHTFMYYDSVSSFDTLKKYIDDGSYDGLFIYTYHTSSSSVSFIATDIIQKTNDNVNDDIIESLCIIDAKSSGEKIELRRLKELNWTKPIIIVPLNLDTFMAKYSFFNDIISINKNIIVCINSTQITLENTDWLKKYKNNNIVCLDLLTHNDYFDNE